ncbi:hypothetical protein RND81_09G135100 [Saponaria officinalis]|uniref:Retrovirus-related Pol polyprotein from transposon TNT 1-94-like beta-barrel domain-containing protein n=1 Tax=Saponaria officinalis TaxID=3572 RepID=A0AAW1IM99_SAPOF
MMSSLLAHEERGRKSSPKVEEKSFQVKAESSPKGKTEYSGKGNGRGGFRGGRGRCGGRGKGLFNEGRQNKCTIQCHYCKNYGHKEATCWIKQKDEGKANFVGKVEEESKLFMAHSSITSVADNIWFIDSGCSNHMSCSMSLFKDLNEELKSEVRLGDDKPIQVEGRGTVSIKTKQGDTKLIYDVNFVPSLAYSLLSVGQLVKSGCSVIFEDEGCTISDKKKWKLDS